MIRQVFLNVQRNSSNVLLFTNYQLIPIVFLTNEERNIITDVFVVQIVDVVSKLLRQ